MGQNSFTEAQFKNTPAKNPKYTPNPPKRGVALLCIFLPPGRSKICKPKASFLKKNVEIYVTRKETIARPPNPAEDENTLAEMHSIAPIGDYLPAMNLAPMRTVRMPNAIRSARDDTSCATVPPKYAPTKIPTATHNGIHNGNGCAR